MATEQETLDEWSRLTGMDDSFSAVTGGTGSFSAAKGFEFLETDIGSALEESRRISASTSDKAYRKLIAHKNCTSYSKLEELHECPRRYELNELQAASDIPLDTEQVNLDFAFGHAVGAGIQTYGATGNLVAAQFAAFCAWKAPWDAEKFDKRGTPSKKSLAHALIAVEKFEQFWRSYLSEFHVVRLPDGRPATELSFCVDFENGFFHFGHIDTILQHNETGQLVVWEGKTRGFPTNEAAYANSNQALSYSVVVDAIARQLEVPADYDVYYIIWNSGEGEFQLLPFHKTRTQRAEWLQDTLLSHSTISTYQRIGFYPKRGSACLNQYGRTCKWFGQCGMSNGALFSGNDAPSLTDVEQVESVDFRFRLSDLVRVQQEK